MGNLVLQLIPDPNNPETTLRAYIYDASGVCIGSVCKRITGDQKHKLCFNFREEYHIVRETLLTPEEIELNEQQINQ